ncbi:hypothetical protein PVAND_015335 [Polypedilum vanderplanki]|uniref:STAS domain-containing protein n=1 Tax=Polypedilum vanderplanki TaxID=319348 RepID=A0A9J6BCQ4_POLVA|nr:hypothetical protein PVAND_015335 [Polypedilum vanderplanki]
MTVLNENNGTNGHATNLELEHYDDNEDYREKFPDIKSIIRRKTSRLCSIEGLFRRIPVLRWLPKYRSSYIVPDFVAGLTVALTVIPQGIADAALAGLDPQYGLYAGFMGCFVYFFLGSTKALTIGPTAILSIMTFTVVGKLNADLAVFSTFVSGCVITLLGVFNLGFLMQFLSMPTVCAFMNAATVIIASGQLRRLFGIRSGKTNEFIDSWVNLVKYIDETRLNDTLLGVISLILLVVVKQWSMKNKKSMFVRYLSISRNAIAVFGGILIAYLLTINDIDSFEITGKIASGFPSLSLPPFSTSHNGTDYSFTDMVSTLGLQTITIPLISVIEAIAIAKSFQRGKTLDVTQEMIALGLCNLTSAFVRSIPITGSFTRSAVNNASGVKTPMGGIYTGAVVLLSLGLLTRTFEFIPKASLAAVIIAAMFTMMNFGEVLVIWRTKKIDLIPFMGTFIMSLLFGLDIGILVGAAIDMIMTVYRASRPRLQYEIIDEKILLVKPLQNVIYSSAEFVKEKVIKKTSENPSIRNVVIDGSSMSGVDLTSVKIIVSLIEDCKVIDVKVELWNWSNETRNGILRFDRKYKSVFRTESSIKEVIENLRNNFEKISIRL